MSRHTCHCFNITPLSTGAPRIVNHFSHGRDRIAMSVNLLRRSWRLGAHVERYFQPFTQNVRHHGSLSKEPTAVPEAAKNNVLSSSILSPQQLLAESLKLPIVITPDKFPEVNREEMAERCLYHRRIVAYLRQPGSRMAKRVRRKGW